MPPQDDTLIGSFLALLRCAETSGLQHEQLAELCTTLEIAPFDDGRLSAPHTLSAVVPPEVLELPKWIGASHLQNDPRGVIVDVELAQGKKSQRFAFANSSDELGRVIEWAAPPRIRTVRALEYQHDHGEWPRSLRLQGS